MRNEVVRELRRERFAPCAEQRVELRHLRHGVAQGEPEVPGHLHAANDMAPGGRGRMTCKARFNGVPSAQVDVSGLIDRLADCKEALGYAKAERDMLRKRCKMLREWITKQFPDGIPNSLLKTEDGQ